MRMRACLLLFLLPADASGRHGQQRLRGVTGIANDCCPSWRPG
jgi:hypothetical protein